MAFPFVQFEFGFQLGPSDGRYLRRSEDGEAERVIVLKTFGAPQRRLLRGRRPRDVADADTAAVPVSRATIIRPDEFEPAEQAERWLARMRSDTDARADEISDASRVLNHLLRAHRTAAADPYARDVVADAATVVRIGYGAGDLVADGRYEAAFELPERPPRRRRVEVLAPQERLAAILSGHQEIVPAEELVLRARADIEAARPREAALQARIALESLRVDLEARFPDAAEPLEGHRTAVAEAANAALEGDPPPELVAAVEDAVAEMERAVRRAALAAGR